MCAFFLHRYHIYYKQNLVNVLQFDANVKMVVDWILQTKGHLTAVTTTPDMYGDDDLHFFLDMDLGILGADRTRTAICPTH